MKYPKQCDRLAAFYEAFEMVTFGRLMGNGTYSTLRAIAWGERVGLQPVPGPRADPGVIAEWERRLEAVLKGRAA